MSTDSRARCRTNASEGTGYKRARAAVSLYLLNSVIIS